MANYRKVQLISYGAMTSEPIRVLPANHPANDYHGDARSRANTLCDVADWVAEEFNQELADSETLKVFVTPEFYFRFGGPSDPENVLLDSYPNGEQLLPNINEPILKQRFAKDHFKDWIVVPGSMFWHKPVNGAEQQKKAYFNSTLVLRGGPQPAPSEQGSANDLSPVPLMNISSVNHKMLMSHIDYSASPKKDRRTWDAAINPTFSRVLLEDDECERWHLFQVRDVQDPAGQPLVFGLEVCLEHVGHWTSNTPSTPDDQTLGGVLRTLRAKKNLPDIDVQIVTSCGMALDEDYGVEAKVNGYAMLCDGMKPPDGSTWPAAENKLVVEIHPDHRHEIADAATTLRSEQVPDRWQRGVPVGALTPNPPDTVSVWNPVALTY